MIDGMHIVGIDPAKAKHQAVLIDAAGVQQGSSFSFDVSHSGYTEVLWRKVRQNLPNSNPKTLAFAVETSCNLWLTVCSYLHAEGYRVLLVSPLTTHHARPMLNHDFSRTDPKDALIIASSARQGYFDLYTSHPPLHAAMHRLGITYDKLRKEFIQNQGRLRALVEQIFPEFLSIVHPDTRTALYLLKRYLHPQEYLAIDLTSEAEAIAAISRRQFGLQTLLQLHHAAQHSIGVPKTSEECVAERQSLNCWITLHEALALQMDQVQQQLQQWAQQLPEYHILLSLKGISGTTAALFLAELQDIRRYDHFKQIEKKAGLNLRLSQSGQFVGTRHISHLGDHRLRWLLYCMTEEAARWIPEVRIKYLHRQLRSRKHRKSIIASTPQLLKLIIALVREHRMYDPREEAAAEMNRLEQQYSDLKEQHAKLRRVVRAPGKAA